MLRIDLNEVSVLRILAPASCMLSLLAAAPAAAAERVVLAMCTTLALDLAGPAAAAAAEAAVQEVARIEAACSTWRPDSAWSRLNAAGGAWVPMQPEWLDLLGRARAWAERTGGAFDPTLRALLQAHGRRDGIRWPVAAARAASGFHLLELAGDAARLHHPAAGLDEGGFLKGHALDAARRAAAEAGGRTGLLDFGGQLLAWGKPRRVAIADPGDRGKARVALDLADASLSTSGCSERGRHLLDPRRGEPCPAWGSVSVVAASAFDADVLSTALYVMGPANGLAWAQTHRVAALFLFNDGCARMSPGFAALRPTFLLGASA